MMQKLLIFSGLIFLMAATPVASVSAAANCKSQFLTFPAWYDGLTDGNCEIKPIGQQKNSLRNFIVRIIFNLTEILLQLVAYASLVFVMIGGFRYLVSTGSPDGMTTAKKTITNALIGLVISIFSIAIVNAAGGLF